MCEECVTGSLGIFSTSGSTNSMDVVLNLSREVKVDDKLYVIDIYNSSWRQVIMRYERVDLFPAPQDYCHVTVHGTVVHFRGSSAHKMMIFFFDVVAWPRGWGVPGVRIWEKASGRIMTNGWVHLSPHVIIQEQWTHRCKSGQNKASSTELFAQLGTHSVAAKQQNINHQLGSRGYDHKETTRSHPFQSSSKGLIQDSSSRGNK